MSKNKRLLFAISGMTLVSVGKEIYDIKTTGFSIPDLIADVLGMLSAVILIKLSKSQEVNMAKWILTIVSWLPKRQIAEIFIEVLKELAKKTDNQLDDQAVLIIEKILDKAFEQAFSCRLLVSS